MCQPSGHSSRESAASISALKEPGGNAAGRLRTTHTASESLKNIGPKSDDTETSSESTPASSKGSISSPEDSPANQQATQENARAQKIPGGSGPKWPESYAEYDPASCLWRILQVSTRKGSGKSSETWPRAGMMRNGIVYPQPRLVPHTSVTESSLLPTPKSRDWKGLSQRGTSAPIDALPNAGRALMPTPTATDSHGRAYQYSRGNHTKPMLTLVGFARKYPTPTRADASRTSAGYFRGNPTLRGLVGGMLNPLFVEWLMGFPLGWTDLKHSATQSSRRSRNMLAGESSQ